MTLNDWAALCRADADKWHRDPATGAKIKRNHGECFMLMVSEIAEAMEGHRKGLMDDKLPHRRMVEVELADLLIRVFDYCGENAIDIDGAVREKMNFNRTRADHMPTARLAVGGKRY